ncbi:teneurin-3-like [Ptychodera flava]|uniref:teneurin-3-like n=1 Tax=Ptychodera flava TaxID=63121 RepID=UPI003969F60B
MSEDVSGPKQNSGWGLIEAGKNFSCNGVVVRKALVDISGNCIPVRLMNVTQQRRLRKDNVLGSFEPVCSMETLDVGCMPIEDPIIDRNPSEIAEYLEDLLHLLKAEPPFKRTQSYVAFIVTSYKTPVAHNDQLWKYSGDWKAEWLQQKRDSEHDDSRSEVPAEEAAASNHNPKSVPDEQTNIESTAKVTTVEETTERGTELLGPSTACTCPTVTTQVQSGSSASTSVETEAIMSTSEAVTTQPYTTEDPTSVVSLNESLPLLIPPTEFQYFLLYLNVTSDLTFVIDNSVSDVKVVMYCRMDFKPTHVDYEVSQNLNVERSVNDSIDVLNVDLYFQNLAPGTWIVGIYNGNNIVLNSTVIAYLKDSAKRCPMDCFERGTCNDGICECAEGWTGVDCSEVIHILCEPDECSGHGTLQDEVCHCFEGWTGESCLQADCIPSDCNGHGSCVDVMCVCYQGWKGIECNEADCIPSDCNGRGQCMNGVCRCDEDSQGNNCTVAFRPCPNDCSGHGDCNNSTGVCNCHASWWKDDCSEVECEDLSCSGLGICRNGTCECDTGWTGPLCTNRSCETGCNIHGTCISGTCSCDKGWSGIACEIDACPNNCTSNGDCFLVDDRWQCVCRDGFKGAQCDIGLELICDDGLDNDLDSFIDCDDSDCCNDTVCEDHPSCEYSDSPEEYAKTQVNGSQSFYDQVSFLFMESSIQIDADEDYIDPSLVTVLRGTVTGRDDTPLQSVIISIQGFPQYGYTITRRDGGFEMAVNGGSVLTAIFSKTNYISAQRSFQPIINQYHVFKTKVILLGIDNKVTMIDLEANEVQVAEGSESNDAAGKRKGVVMFHPGTEATIMSYNGTENQTVNQPSVRITEYTVGENGEEAMPAELPPFTGYTYAMELSVDEASVNGSTDVFFNQNLFYYVENYLGFPVGSAVPTGFYNRSRGEWIASENGLVIRLLNSSDFQGVSVDVTGDSVPATDEELAALGFNDDELQLLGNMYTVGQSLWRVPIRHFTPWDCNWPYAPPMDACVPAECNELLEPISDCNKGSVTPTNQASTSANTNQASASAKSKSKIAAAEYNDIVTPKYPRIPSIPHVPGVPHVPGIPPTPGLPPAPGIPLPRSEVKPHQDWNVLYPSIPDGVENLGDYGPLTEKLDESHRYWHPNGSVELHDLSKDPGTIQSEIAGTSVKLVYNHKRQAGYMTTFNVHLTGGNVPKSMKNVIAEVTIAGKTYRETLAPREHLTVSIPWDGKDAYGRFVFGSIKALVRTGYQYDLVYYPVRTEFQQSFNRLSQADTTSTFSRGDQTATYWEESEIDVVRDMLNPGLGGWSLNIHHSYDVNAGVLHTGDGNVIAYTDKRKALKTVAGSDTRANIDCKTCGEGFSEETKLRLPVAVAASPDGSVFLGDYNFIRRIWPNGTVSTVTQLADSRPKHRYYLATNPRTGNIYMSDSARRQVVLINPDTGEEKVFAGTGERCPPWENGCGDNGLALKASLNTPKGIAVSKEGDVFIVDNRRIRQIGSDGIIEAYVGTNEIDRHHVEKSSENYDAPMGKITFTWPTDIAIHPEDDTLYIIDGDVVFTLTRHGNVRPIIGRTPVRPPVYPLNKQKEREEVLDANLISPQGITVSSSGLVYICETDFKYIHRVRAYRQGSGVFPVAGQASACACDAGGCHCFSEGPSAVASQMYAPTAATLTGNNELFIADQGNYRIRAMKGTGKKKTSGDYIVPGQNPNDVLVFNRQGHHLRTLDIQTKRLIHMFDYDENGLLSSLTDGRNNSLLIERLSDGSPHAIVSPNGIRTILGLNSEGMVNFISDPTEGITRLKYQKGGLVRGITYPDGFDHYLAYDENGRVFAQYDNLGRRELYGNFQGSTSNTVTTYTSLNREQSVETQSSSSQIKKIYKSKAGKTHEVISKVQEDETETIFPDDTKIISYGASHPVWGPEISLPGSEITRLPSGQQQRVDIDYYATLSDPNDPLSLQTLGTQTKINDQTMSTIEYNHDDKTSTLSLGNDVHERIIYDEIGRLERVQRPAQGLADTVVEYTDQTSNEVKRLMQGDLWQEYEYDDHGNLISERSKSGSETKFEHLANGKLSNLTLPSGRSYRFRYDDSGNFVSITMPSGSVHHMRTLTRTLSRDEVYQAPLSAQPTFLSSFNLDGDLMQTLHPVTGGASYWYDDFERLTAITFNEHFVHFTYKDNSNNVVSVNRYRDRYMDSMIDFSYDGFLQTHAVFSDHKQILGTFTYHYNNLFLVDHIKATVYGDSYSTILEYDNLGEITKYGTFSISKVSTNTQRISDSNAECTYTHDQNGRMDTMACTINSEEKFFYQLKYNNDSLVSERTFKISIYEYENRYTYDTDGQLVNVTKNGESHEHYEYDINGNRISWGGVGGRDQHSAIYDDNDRIQQFDSLLCKFTDDGFLLRKGSAIFAYNAKGELEKASENGFYVKKYRYDGLGRLIESFDSSSGEGIRYFYGDPANAIRVTHVVHGEEELVTALYYNQLGHLFAMVTEDVISYVMCDHLGTPMAVFDEQGRLLKIIIRDSYGVLLSNSAPGVFVPIGYAGGIDDDKTGFTRFHFRDYDNEVGRWTSRDPSLYSSSQPNLYQYVFNDPINLRDPLGLFCIGGSFYKFIGGGVELCFSRNGWSACVEAGLGFQGPSFGIDSGEPKKGFTSEIFADASLSVPGYSIGGRAALKFQPTVEPCVETTTFDEVGFGRLKRKQESDGTYQDRADLTPLRTQRKKKVGIGAKVGVKACYGS